jgi:signal peptidase II
MKKIHFILFSIVIISDQISKFYIKSHFALHESKPVIKGFFNITYVLNPGAAFGFLANLSETYRKSFFIVITILAICAIIYLYLKESSYKFRSIAYVLIISGAFGNFIDRVYMGKVVDFLDFYIKNYHWPAFNIADSSISIGIFFLILDLIFINKGEKNETRKKDGID